MSSRLLPPDDSRAAEPVLWPSATAVSQPEVSRNAAPEPRADTAQIEREWRERVAAARAAGIREGETAGRSRAAAELQPVLERLARSIDEMAGLRHRLRREAEADTVKLALAIARRVIRRELAVDPSALHGLVLAALEKLQAQEISRVRVHPSHAAAIAALLRERPGGTPIEVSADPSNDPGAAVFETTRGNLDASVESQLGEIERGLADALRRQR
jgi:flagellar assembly protein FliH